jgi:chaperonin GroEL
MLEDIAVLTGGQVISEDLGMKLETRNNWMMLGTCKESCNRLKTNRTIVAGAGEKAEIRSTRCNQIRTEIKLLKQHQTTTKKNYKND